MVTAKNIVGPMIVIIFGIAINLISTDMEFCSIQSSEGFDTIEEKKAYCERNYHLTFEIVGYVFIGLGLIRLVMKNRPQKKKVESKKDEPKENDKE